MALTLAFRITFQGSVHKKAPGPCDYHAKSLPIIRFLYALPFLIFNVQHGELLFCRSGGARLLFVPPLSVELGFCTRPLTMGLCAVGWHMLGSLGYCSPPLSIRQGRLMGSKTLRPSVTLLPTEHSHIVHSCTKRWEWQSEAVPLWLRGQHFMLGRDILQLKKACL